MKDKFLRLLRWSLPVSTALLFVLAAAFVVGAQQPPLAPGPCWEIDESNKAEFKVGDPAHFGLIPAMEDAGAIGTVSGFNLTWGLIAIRPTGDPHQQQINELIAKETFDPELRERYPSPQLRALKASHPGKFCVAGTGKGAELVFPMNYPHLRHLKRAQ